MNYLGMTRYIEQSGDSIKIKFGGSSMVRAHLYAMEVGTGIMLLRSDR